MRLAVILLLAACLLPPVVRAQDSTHTAAWAFNASVYGYLVPDSPDFLQPTITADHRWLHLEGRYNYESPNAASLWAGWNLHTEGTLTVDATPMFGVVFGSLNGVAPGLELAVKWWKLEFSSQTEYVIDLDDEDGNFLYTWSQLGISPVDWLQVGFVVQRTQLFDTGRDIERGLFAAATYKWFEPAVYLFNPDAEPTLVLAVGASF